MKLPWTSNNAQESAPSSAEPLHESENPNNSIRTENIKVHIPAEERREQVREQEMLTNYTPGQKILLRDTKPKYSENEQNSEKTYEQLLETFSKDDLKPSNLVVVPCFRQAGLLGLSTMFVVGSVMFISLKNVKRASNWAVAGFGIGSIFGWEKCRYQRRKELQIANKLDALQQAVKEKQEKKLNSLQENAAKKAQDQEKSWYKFW
ncbi:hypothetical protein ACO0RG_002680 [Hanseniaspora osmophila]|uniref:Cytochrome c oxidase assembly protein COX20, mitochondrial n=1 Tax=Hanseniaspora osmophila TaxID=56408 RepID=A0A1E5R7F8_9ASCO|nr:Cytochrome c oxidase protein 20, mitochondrial [Hanseniaspora osmophila]